MENNYNCLDLDIIKNQVANFASIQEAKDFILNEKVIFNPLKIKQNAIETKEAINIINSNINIQFSGINNVNDIFDKADKEIILESYELRDVLVFHNHCLRIKNIFSNIEGELYLKDYTGSINVNNAVFDKVNSCIENSGDIKEDATPLLKDLNRRIDSIDKSIYAKAEQFINSHSSSLQELTMFVRENRVVFLIKNQDKNKYQGYQYGQSASGLANYIEPQIFVDINNEKIDLIHQKADEINRILKELTYLISTCKTDYQRNFDTLVKLNVIFAKANYGFKNNGIIPDFIEDKYFDFKDLCHPLLDLKTVVSNSYRIMNPYRGIVISGSNTGGKTVSLKAIGLSIIMSYLGIPIIASSANIPFYKNVYVDIDDNQSIQNSLSTFSAHISNINSILKEASEDSLILIDELISGTDPKQAQGISLAILDKIKDIGSIFIITTHFDDIKNYSYNDENIMLSSVGFDMDSLKPTFKYYENSIGASNALEIASKYFDDQSLIDNARKYIKANETKQDELLAKLSKQIEEINIEKTKIDNLKNEYEQILNQTKEEKVRFENEKQELRKKYMDELNEYIEEMKDKAQEKLDSIKEKKDNKIINEIDELSNDEFKKEVHEFTVGDNVRIGDNEQIGTIVEISGSKAKIDIRGISVKADLSDLFLMPKIEKKQTYKEKIRRSNVSKEINLVGYRVEDALPQMEEYLDAANAANLSSVKVIHGIGTGALRKALRERIKKLSYVKSFNDGDFYDGGSAVTIVEFK